MFSINLTLIIAAVVIIVAFLFEYVSCIVMQAYIKADVFMKLDSHMIAYKTQYNALHWYETNSEHVKDKMRSINLWQIFIYRWIYKEYIEDSLLLYALDDSEDSTNFKNKEWGL